MINQCKGFYNKVKQMMIQWILWIEKGTDIEVSMLDESRKNKEVCWMQFTISGMPKLVLSKPIVTNKGNYNALTYNYGCSFHSTQPTPVFQAEVGGLTCNGRCFTLEEFEKQRKAKGE
jgi:hypothetical protein